MSYTNDGLIQIGDYNPLVIAIKSIYGVGAGETGYGQTAISMTSSVSVSDQVKTSQWKPLRDAILVCANHQGTATTLPTDPALNLDHLIRDYPGLIAASTDINTNRHNGAPGSYTLFSNVANSTYSTNWATSINFSFDAIWTNPDKARYFWNSGGAFNIAIQFVPTGVYPRGVAWSSFINQLGGLAIRWNKTTMISAYPGTQSSANVGYYGLPTSPLLLWQGCDTQGSYAFPTNNITVYGQSIDGPVGVNGDNGTHLRYTVSFNDVSTTGSNVVIGSWNAQISVSKATTYLTQETPVVTIHSDFAGS